MSLTGPILVSHQGKLALLHPNGRKTDYATGKAIVDLPQKPRPITPARWHDPYG